MATQNEPKKISFSLHEVCKPKFTPSQINPKPQRINTGIPKTQSKLVVGRNGKIGYSK